MILALDIGTKITGVTVLDYEGKVLLNEAWYFKRCKTFYEKVSLADDKLLEIYNNPDFRIERVYVEESLQRFAPGYSTAKILLTIGRFNGTLSWLVYKTFGIEVEYIGASTARKQCGIKIPRGQKAKAVVLQHLLDNEPWFVVEYTKYGNPKSEYFDMADSFVIAKAGLLLCQQIKS